VKPTITVPTGYVKQLLDQVAEQNYDVDELLEYVGIDAKEIEHQTEFPASKFGFLYQHVMYITQDEYFGMLSGSKLPLGAFRMMCHAIIHCKNMGHAINRASKFHDIVRGSKIKPSLQKKGEFAQVSFSAVDSLEQAEIEQLMATEEPASICTSLSVWHHFISWLIGERVELEAVNFSFSANRAAANCQTRFQTDVHYQQMENAIIFPARYLEYPIIQNEETLRGFLKTAPYQLLVMVDDSGSLKNQVIALIGQNFSMAPPSADKVARTLNMSLSTLRRRLLEEGTTFQKIKDECRKNSAIKFMGSPQLSIPDVAELMGFDEPSAFFRSFKRWTGMTPGEYRQSQEYASQLQGVKK
jgi:AraC-like DNA-binding protein